MVFGTVCTNDNPYAITRNLERYQPKETGAWGHALVCLPGELSEEEAMPKGLIPSETTSYGIPTDGQPGHIEAIPRD